MDVEYRWETKIEQQKLSKGRIRIKLVFCCKIWMQCKRLIRNYKGGA